MPKATAQNVREDSREADRLHSKNSTGLHIVFICGTAEPGRDGVGDYTCRLAGELIRQGHEVAVIAANDKFIQETYEGPLFSYEASLAVLRLPGTQSWEEREKRMMSFISSRDPQWISLQYVPYSFSKKGLPFFLSNKFKKVSRGRKWHIMFHELWLGMEMQASLKNRIIGRIQHQLIRSLVRKMKPAKVHTQIQLYQIKLRQLGVEAHLLPLFGNITSRIPEMKLGLNKSAVPPAKLKWILFGSIHPHAPVEEFANEMAAYATKTGFEVSLVMVGRNGAEQERWKNVWVNAGLAIEILGEQDPQVITQAMQQATMGIATTPLVLIEKSGSAIAMQEQGLPVLCISKAWDVKEKNEIQIPNGILEYRPGSLSAILASKPFVTSRRNLGEIASDFVHGLTTLQ